MDCLGYGRSRHYKPGDVIYVVLHGGLLKENRRGQVGIGANPERRKALEELGGWRYRAYGAFVATGYEARLDCGTVEVDLATALFVEPDMLGNFVTIDIDRLECWRKSNRRTK